jgi:hypothetical protein
MTFAAANRFQRVEIERSPAVAENNPRISSNEKAAACANRITASRANTSDS